MLIEQVGNPGIDVVVEEFVDRLHQQLAAMRDTWRAEDFVALAKLAHWLKGSGGTAGFDALTSPGGLTETAARIIAKRQQMHRSDRVYAVLLTISGIY